MGKLAGVIERLKGLREELGSPVVFYAEHRDDWLKFAKAIVRQAMLNLRPIGVDHEMWIRQVDLAAARVSVDLLGEDEAGVIVALGSSSADDPMFEAIDGNLSLDQIEAWVQAGHGGQAGGKRLDERDALLSDEKIARNVLYAMKLGKPGTDRLRAAILEYIGGEIAEQAERLYPEIRKAWVDLFSVKCASDWREWVAGRAKKV